MGPLGFLMTLMDTVEVATLEGDRLSYAVTLNCNPKIYIVMEAKKTVYTVFTNGILCRSLIFKRPILKLMLSIYKWASIYKC